MTTEPTASIDTNESNGSNIVKDGLSGRVEPLAREAVDAAGPEAGSEDNSGPEKDNTNAAPVDAAPDDVEGVNKAVGPAEESDDQVGDKRALTTDTSPSD